MKGYNFLVRHINHIIAFIFLGVVVYAIFPTDAKADIYNISYQQDTIKPKDTATVKDTVAVIAKDSVVAKTKDTASAIVKDTAAEIANDTANVKKIAVIAKDSAITTTKDTIAKIVTDSIASTKDTTAEIAKDNAAEISKGAVQIDSTGYAVIDSLDLAQLVNLKIQGEDSLITLAYDSLQVVYDNKLAPLDSLHLQELAFPPIQYTKGELRRKEREARQNYRDSVIKSKPRFLYTYMFADSVKYQKTFSWRNDPYFNNPKIVPIDTSYNYHYSELPADINDVNATSLGISGSAMQYYNYFKREENPLFPFISPYMPYSYSPETIPFYNTKTPLTELAYWGTLFANKQKEESNVKFNHSQNFTPAFNFNILYQRFGAKGILKNETTDDRTFAFTVNHLGTRYVAQAGYIYNKIKRNENGGVADIGMVLDTIVDPKVIPIVLNNASTTIKKNTVFITQSYGVPFNIFAKRDSLGNKGSDTLGLDKGTVTFFGHSGEFSTFTKSYTDNIDLTDSTARKLYNNKFYINPTLSADSARVMKLENRLFISLQPWKRDAIVSRLDAGVAFQHLGYYNFNPSFFLSGNRSISQNNTYLYFGASGQLKKYFSWEGLGKYNVIGYNANDFLIDGKIKLAAFPGKSKNGIFLNGRIYLALTRPGFFYNNYYSNHYVWSNDFGKTTETKIEASLDIPKWNFELFFGYSLINNNIYFDKDAIVRQNTSAMNILTAYLRKDFRLWLFHFNNKVLFQTSSNESVVPLPKIALNLRYFLQFDLVKDVMALQLGANATFNTKYYAPGYSPALGLFYNQQETKVGDNPYIDLFVNIQWKRASIYVKYINAAQHWPTSDYFSANRYLRPAKAFKVGVYWPFYF